MTKLASRGVWNHDLAEVLYRNCRLPEWNRCDTLALVAACRLGKRTPETSEDIAHVKLFMVSSVQLKIE